MTRARAAVVTLAAVLISAPGAARAHELDAASLSLSEIDGGRFSVRWHASSRTLQDDLAGAVGFPKQCRLEGATLACQRTENRPPSISDSDREAASSSCARAAPGRRWSRWRRC